MLGLTVLVIGLCTGVLSMLTSLAGARAAGEQSLAVQAVESVVETLLAAEFDEVFVRFNAITGDDPDPVTGPSPGDRFDVPGLNPWPGEALPGQILFPGDNIRLAEDVNDPTLGMPRDLDLDGVIDALDKRDAYRVLPVSVRVRWRGGAGQRELLITTTLTGRPRMP